MGIVLLPAGHTGNMLGALDALTGQRPEMLDVLQCSRPFHPIMNYPMACAALKCFAEEVSENSLHFSEPVTEIDFIYTLKFLGLKTRWKLRKDCT